MITVRQAWYVKQLPQHVVAELTDGKMMMFRLTPFRAVREDELEAYAGYHPSRCTSSVVPDYVLKHYGIESETLPPTRETGGLTTLEAEREYGLPEGTIRRDIHRGRFEDIEYQKIGRGWIISREAIERVYKKEAENMFKLDIYEVTTKEVGGYTVADDSVEWELIETIEGETEERCYAQANAKYDQENYHWTTPYLV